METTTYEWTDKCYSGLKKVDPQYQRFASIIKELNESSDKAISRRLRTEMVLTWQKGYNVGVREIDSQHKVFFKIIKKLAKIQFPGIRQTDKAAELDKVLDELLDYAQLHFQTEEKLMERYGYPMINDQKKEHEIITAELDRQIKAIKGSNGSTAKLVYFLVQWFIKHTVYSDKDLGLFIREKRKTEVFGIDLKAANQKVTGFLNQPLTTVDIMNFLNQPLTLNIWGHKNGSAYPA
ncbi:hypothetical protein GKODMF_06350 [Candidatus Electrothrix gigas]|jgi:hemerythrin-like metal-binding protein